MIVSERKLAIDLRIDRATLRDVANCAGGMYRSFDIRALGSSKWRHIDEPSHRLAAIQRAILRRIFDKVVLPSTMTGGLKGRSLLDHARPHCRKSVVVTLDLAHCFPTITSDRVYNLFVRRLDYSPSLSNMLTKLTTLRRRLPQGSSTSPFIAALAMEGLHTEIAALCVKRGLSFTQFVDDLAVSGPEGTEQVIPELVEIVQSHGFAISRRKVRVMRASEQQVVTGLVVNRHASIGRAREDALKLRIRSHYDALFILEGDRRSLEGSFAFAEYVAPAQAERLRRFALLFLPLSNRGVEVLKSSRTEHRECTAMRCQSSVGEVASRHQPSLPSLGRRKFEGAARAVSSRPRPRRTRQIEESPQLALGLVSSEP